MLLIVSCVLRFQRGEARPGMKYAPRSLRLPQTSPCLLLSLFEVLLDVDDVGIGQRVALVELVLGEDLPGNEGPRDALKLFSGKGTGNLSAGLGGKSGRVRT